MSKFDEFLNTYWQMTPLFSKTVWWNWNPNTFIKNLTILIQNWSKTLLNQDGSLKGNLFVHYNPDLIYSAMIWTKNDFELSTIQFLGPNRLSLVDCIYYFRILSVKVFFLEVAIPHGMDLKCICIKSHFSIIK